MKTILNFFGIALIVVGIIVLSYEGFHYTKQEKIAQIGDIQVTVPKEERIYFPPLLGGLSLATGIVLLIIARINKS